MNPFLVESDLPFKATAFDKIKKVHYLPALKELIQKSKRVIDEVKKIEKADFENTILRLEEESYELNHLNHTFFNLHSSLTDDEMQELAEEFSPIMTEYENDYSLDEELFHQVKSVYDEKNSFDLNQEQNVLLDKYYKSFTRNGALLSNQDKEELRYIDKRLASLSLSFGDNVLKDKNRFELYLSEEELKGLPENYIEAAKLQASEKGHEGKCFVNLDHPSSFPLAMYAESRELREKMYRSSAAIATNGDDLDNKQNVLDIAKLRFKRAKLLGYASHAAFVLEERMAETSNTVINFLTELKANSFEAAQKELNELKDYAKKTDGIDQIKGWDASYYFNKLKKEKFDFDSEKLRPYFSLEKVIAGVFSVANKLYGLNFKENKSLPTYHEDVKLFEVTDRSGTHVGLFYSDFFPRKSKRSGAWMTEFKGQHVTEGKSIRPHIAIVCNFTKPTKIKPSLLDFNEVLTLFHEFGHALHGLLSQCQYESTSGTNVNWDFVELPSQILENWAYEKECLDLFAEHYETGEKIPEDYINKIKETSTFHEARATIRQISFATMDMAWHNGDPSEINSVNDFENSTLAELRLLPEVEGACLSTKFSHIFQGGYSAGYYSYKWAEVLDADAFEYFKEAGIFNKEIATKFYDNILTRGGSEKPMELYKKFRGQEPDPKALLRRSGLI